MIEPFHETAGELETRSLPLQTRYKNLSNLPTTD